jgi:hypothetical protein
MANETNKIDRTKLLEARQMGILNDNGINLLINDLLHEVSELRAKVSELSSQTKPESAEKVSMDKKEKN